jgi:uncharacterized protein (DUF305 family)
MRTSALRKMLVVSALAAGACRTASAPPPSAPIVQPGAPGEPSRIVEAPAATRRPSFTDADVKFMQGMMHHHAQAVDMVELLKTRSKSDDMKKLGQRIELSQVDEIDMMRKWLEARGQEAPAFARADAGGPDSAKASAGRPDSAKADAAEHAHHMAGGPMMPGMLTPQQMDQLAAANGPAFDRLFLEFMIRHHEGALTMVKELFASPGAAQDSDVFAFASDVDADQQMEIARMSAMLKELEK